MLLIILGYIMFYVGVAYIDYSVCVFLKCEWAFWVQVWAVIAILIGYFFKEED